jgi:hypothetical protein
LRWLISAEQKVVLPAPAGPITRQPNLLMVDMLVSAVFNIHDVMHR